MAKTLYKIELTDAEREKLQKIIAEGNESERTILRAKIILMSDIAQTPKYTVVGLAKALGTTDTTVQTTRTEYGKGGLEAAVYRKKPTAKSGAREIGERKTGAYKLTEDVVAQITQLSQSKPPEGHKRWTTRLLCTVCMERGIIDHIAPSSMCVLLKKAGVELKK